MNLADQYPPEHCPDSVWVLSRGSINWTSPENGKADPGRSRLRKWCLIRFPRDLGLDSMR
jgi:hypothetical protein